MFKKKVKKENLFTNVDLNADEPVQDVPEEKNEDKIRGIIEESKKIKKRPFKGVEANPQRMASPPPEDKKGMTGLLDKEFLRQSGKVDIVDRNLEKHLSENLLNDPFGGKFTRTKAPEQQKSILKALEAELGHVFKINEISKSFMDEAKDQTTWTSGMMEVQVSLDQKAKNIEASEAAKKGNAYIEPAQPKREFKINEKDKEYKKSIKNLEQAFRKEGRKFVNNQMMKKMESSSYEMSQNE